eukprot:SAG11_NODE_1330_length_5187_cov_6.700079_5_plen_290_part_00
MSGHPDYELMFGQNHVKVTIDLPAENVMEVNKPEMPPVAAGPFRAVAEALENPFADAGVCPTLTGEVAANEAAGKPAAEQKVCILICDITRPVPNGLLLPRLVKQLTESGIVLANITILNATGLHRPNESAGKWGDERKALIVMGDREIAAQAGGRDPLGGGERIVEQIDGGTLKFANHFAKKDDDHVSIGTTPSRGVEAFIDGRFVEADVRIATGLVEPHFMAGYSGGRKVISPGKKQSESFTALNSCRTLTRHSATWKTTRYTRRSWRCWSSWPMLAARHGFSVLTS